MRASRDSGPAAESAARRRNDTAMERRGAQASPIARRDRAPQGADYHGRLAALHSLIVR